MKKILATVSLTASALLGPATAAAHPYTLYEFKVLSYQCSWGDGSIVDATVCNNGTYGLDDLNGLRVGLSADEGFLHIETHWYFEEPGNAYYSRSNVSYNNFGRIGTRVDLAAELCFDGPYGSYGSYFCRLDSAFRFDEVLNGLTGYLFTLTTNDQVEMWSGGSTIWSGFYGSDSLGPYRLYFTGTWYETPEPTTLALFGAGLVGMIGLRRRRAEKRGRNDCTSICPSPGYPRNASRLALAP
ncbi:PEP-CTERM sorting domain-containing protein [Pseudorhodoferax sp.]|uniref:PEP-CTERM sorting domain-containing protein n=1 Tax=Pseudorhodoferax sp. TaxID=1993553 RepID=UPI0039E62BD6